MEFPERMNLAMEYIEKNLHGEINYEELAHLIGCTEYHISRMFPFVTGQALSQYIKRRRMSQAAMDLQNPKTELLDIALKYGYSSVDSFSRAFRDVHNIPPSTVRGGESSVRSFPKLEFKLIIQGADAMVYRIVSKDAFRIVGIKKSVPIIFSGPNKAIDEMWKTLTPELISHWKSIANTEPGGIISASTNFSEERMSGIGTLDHYIGVATTLKSTYEMSSIHVLPGDWAIFEAIGNFPKNLQSVWGRIYSEWFPQSDFELREGPEMLWNEGPDTAKSNFKSEIWIPIRRKK